MDFLISFSRVLYDCLIKIVSLDLNELCGFKFLITQINRSVINFNLILVVLECINTEIQNAISFYMNISNVY